MLHNTLKELYNNMLKRGMYLFKQVNTQTNKQKSTHTNRGRDKEEG